jgi:hypothetical protein
VAGTRATLVPDILGSIIASLDSGSGALTKVAYLPRVSVQPCVVMKSDRFELVETPNRVRIC